MANDRDCENCTHKINGACKVWECKFEPKRGMTKEEAIEIIECGEISNRWGKDGEEVEEMAIKALKQIPSISEDGTLTVNVEDGSKVSRVLVCGDNHFGGLYYPDQEPCDKCVYSTSEGCQYDDITETIPPLNNLPPVNSQEPCSNCCNGNQIEKAKLCQKSYLAGMEHKQKPCEDAISADVLNHWIGAEVLDKVRAEIEQEYNRLSATRADETLELGECLGLKMSLKIIDKYKAEGSEKE